MADTKITLLTADTTPTSDDVTVTVDITSGLNKKVTLGNLVAKAHGVLTTLGDMIYGGASGVLTRVAGNTTTTKKFFRQTGDGANSAAPAWDTVTSTDVGLGNCDNTSDANKPVSSATQTALNLKADLISPVFTTPNIGVATGSVSGSSGSCTGNAATATSATTSTNLTGGNGTTLLGSVPYQSNTDTTTQLAPNTTTTKKFFRQTGTGTNGAAPAWDTVTASDVGLGSVTNESKATMFTSPTFTGTATAPILNVTSAYSSEIDDGNSSTADTIDWTTGNNHKSTLTGNCTYTFTAPTGPAHITLKMVQDATGTRTVTFPATVKWQEATQPTWNTGANKVNLAFFYWDGTSYYGSGVTGAA